MDIKLLSKNMDLTPAVKDYVLKRVTKLGKLLKKIEDKGGEVKINFEVSKNTKHHKSGMIFHSDSTVNIDGKKYYYSIDKEDLYEAIDAVKESLWHEISKVKGRVQTLEKRGARSIKKMMKGLSKRDPQTSKY